MIITVQNKKWTLLVLFVPQWLAGAQIEVPKWSMYEIDVTGRGTSANWYTDRDARMVATFRGPAGTIRKVPGFWDGGNSFKIRFTPTLEGTWTYRISSSNAGLNGNSGTIKCVAPPAGTHGFLRIDSQYPSSFVWDDGTRYFMWGQSYYEVLQPAMVNDHWKISVDKSHTYGMNKVRMHVYAQNYYKPGIEFVRYPDAQPYLGYSKDPDRDRLNIPYFRKLDEIVHYMGSKGVVADLIVTNPYWDNRQFGTGEQNDRFVQYVVARYAAYSNVIWCLANEWELSARGRQYLGKYRQQKSDFDRMGALVRDGDPWMAEGDLLRPLSIHNTSIDFEFFASRWPTHVIVQYGGWNPDYTNGDQWGNAGIVHNLGRKVPVVNDEYGYIGQTYPKPAVRVNMTRTRLRGAIWGIATAGGYGSAGDFRLADDGMGNVELTGEWLDAPEEYGDLKRMINFFTTRGIDYWKMSCHNELLPGASRAYLLAEVGRQYVVYAATGGSISLDLAAGTYTAWQYDPINGTETSLGTVAGGGVRTLATPTDRDYTVYLKRVR